MHISGTSIQPLSNTPVGRGLQTAAETDAQVPARRERAPRVPAPARDAQVIVERFQTPITAGRGYPRAGGVSAQHAINAYIALERSEELEYMRTVLGIDEYA